MRKLLLPLITLLLFAAVTTALPPTAHADFPSTIVAAHGGQYPTALTGPDGPVVRIDANTLVVAIESHSSGDDSSESVSVYRSTDNGATWALWGSVPTSAVQYQQIWYDSVTGRLYVAGIRRFATDCDDEGDCYWDFKGGVRYSTDQGKTWSSFKDISPGATSRFQTGGSTPHYGDVKVGRVGRTVGFLMTPQQYARDVYAFVSPDGGATWPYSSTGPHLSCYFGQGTQGVFGVGNQLAFVSYCSDDNDEDQTWDYYNSVFDIPSSTWTAHTPIYVGDHPANFQQYNGQYLTYGPGYSSGYWYATSSNGLSFTPTSKSSPTMGSASAFRTVFQPLTAPLFDLGSGLRWFYPDLKEWTPVWTAAHSVFSTAPLSGSTIDSIQTSGSNWNWTFTYHRATIGSPPAISASGTPAWTNTTTPTLTWAFTDPDGDDQAGYHVIIKRQSDGTLLTDSGIVASSTSSYTVPVAVMTAGQTYRYDIYGYDAVYMRSPVATGTIGVDMVSPTGTLAISNSATYANSGTVTLNLAAADDFSGVAKMRFRNAGLSWSAWVPYASTYSWTLDAPGIDGTKTVEAQFQDNAGNLSTIVNDAIILDQTAPTGSLKINNAAAYTTTTAVTLTLSATDSLSGIQDMRLRNSGGAWGSWAPVVASKSWTLSGGAGNRGVDVEYRDVAGNSRVYTATITLDGTGPAVSSVAINGGSAYATGTAVAVTVNASDATSGLTGSLQLSNDGTTYSTTAAVWSNGITTVNWTLAAGDGTKTVYVKVGDLAGNWAAARTDGITLDTVAPTVSTVTINSGATYTKATAVTVNITGSDATSGLPTSVQVSNDGVSFSAVASTWNAAATAVNWTLTAGDGSKTIWVKVADKAGNYATTKTDTITLDTVAPAFTAVSVNSGSGYTGSTSATVTLAGGSDATSGLGTSVQLSNDGTSYTTVTATWNSGATTVNWTLSAGEGAKTVYAKIVDAAGNWSAAKSDGITLDATAPTVTTVNVNGGAAFANTTSVTVTLSGVSDAVSGLGTSVQLSNDGTSYSTVTATWSSGAATVNWTLTAGDGAKTVYVKTVDAAGNWSAAKTDGITLDMTAPTATSVSIIAGATYATSTSVTVTISGAADATSGLAGNVQLSNDGTNYTPVAATWSSGATTVSWTLAAGDGSKTVYARVGDKAGNWRAALTDGITLDVTAPAIPTLSFSGTNVVLGYAGTTAVTVTVSSSDATAGMNALQLSSDGSTWTTFAGSWSNANSGNMSVSWTLTSGQGSKTVQAKVVDKAGNTSTPGSASITLDLTAPALSEVSINTAAAYTGSATVTVTLTGSDSLSGLGSIRLSNDGATYTPVSATWAGGQTGVTWTLADGVDGLRTVYAQVADAVGNWSSALTDTITLDTQAPTATIDLPGQVFGTTFTATVAATDPTGGSGVSTMAYQVDTGGWSAFGPYATSFSAVINPVAGLHSVSVQFRDGVGNTSQVYTAYTQFTTDMVVPTLDGSINGGASTVSNLNVTLSVWAADNKDPASSVKMRFSNDGGTNFSAWVAYATTYPWTLAAGSDGLRTVMFQVQDASGNVALITRTVQYVGVGSAAGGTVSSPSGAAGPYTVNGIPLSVRFVSGPAVTISMSSVSATQMRLSVDGVTFGPWLPYAASQTVLLPSSDGAHRVAVQFSDANGTPGPVYTSDFVLDQTKPTVSLAWANDATATQSGTAQLLITATDTITPADSLRYSYSLDGETWTASATPSPSITLPGTGRYTVWVTVTDQAGNSTTDSLSVWSL